MTPLTDEQRDAILDRQGHDPCPGVEILFDIELQRVGDWRQHATVFRSAARPAVPSPALLAFHGGGFANGDPNGCGALGKYLALTLGLATVSVSYRLGTPSAPSFPAPIHDAGDAWRWLLREATRWNIDPARIAVHGESAGCFLAAHLLLTLDRPDLAGGGRLRAAEPASAARPAAFIAGWGPLDLVARWFDRGENAGAEINLFGKGYDEIPALYHHTSPLAHAHGRRLPPALFAYGRQDSVVHARQGRLGHAAWRAAGAHAELIVLDNFGHDVTGDGRPSRLAFLEKSAAFLEARL